MNPYRGLEVQVAGGYKFRLHEKTPDGWLAYSLQQFSQNLLLGMHLLKPQQMSVWSHKEQKLMPIALCTDAEQVIPDSVPAVPAVHVVVPHVTVPLTASSTAAPEMTMTISPPASVPGLVAATISAAPTEPAVAPTQDVTAKKSGK